MPEPSTFATTAVTRPPGLVTGVVVMVGGVVGAGPVDAGPVDGGIVPAGIVGVGAVAVVDEAGGWVDAVGWLEPEQAAATSATAAATMIRLLRSTR